MQSSCSVPGTSTLYSSSTYLRKYTIHTITPGTGYSSSTRTYTCQQSSISFHYMVLHKGPERPGRGGWRLNENANHRGQVQGTGTYLTIFAPNNKQQTAQPTARCSQLDCPSSCQPSKFSSTDRIYMYVVIRVWTLWCTYVCIPYILLRLYSYLLLKLHAGLTLRRSG